MERLRTVIEERLEQQDNDVFRTLKPLIKGKRVLDCGSAQHTKAQIIKSPKPWIHAFLVKHAKAVIGVDIAKQTIKDLNKEGYNLKYLDVEKMTFNNEFDVVFGGDIIEHLSNPGLFLENCHHALNPRGTLVLTTPNTFCLMTLLRVIFGFTNNPKANKEHTMWFSPQVIKELLKREGFKNIRITYCAMNNGFIAKLSKVLGKRILAKMLVRASK